jgi:hypothetical protein
VGTAQNLLSTLPLKTSRHSTPGTRLRISTRSSPPNDRMSPEMKSSARYSGSKLPRGHGTPSLLRVLDRRLDQHVKIARRPIRNVGQYRRYPVDHYISHALATPFLLSDSRKSAKFFVTIESSG